MSNPTIEFLEKQNKLLLEMLGMKYLCEPIVFKLDLKSFAPLPPTKTIMEKLKNGGFIETKGE